MIKRLGLALALTCASAVVVSAAETKTPPALGWHFAGLRALPESSSGTTLQEIAALPRSGPLAVQVRGLLTQHLPDWFEFRTPQISAEVMAPLVADLLDHESAAHFDGEELARSNWVLGIRVGAAGRERWQGALLTVGRRLGLGEPEPLKVAGLTGWRIPGRATGARGFSIATHPEWVLIASEFKDGATAHAWAAALAKDGRPLAKLNEEWLRADVTPAALGWPSQLPFTGSIAHISAGFSWQGKDVRTTARITPAQPVRLSGAAWQIPKGIALDPLVSFTAVRNLQKFFSELPAVRGLNAGLIPDQWFGWSRGTVAFINDFAVPVADAGQVYAHLERSIPAAHNPRLMELALGQWLTATNAASPRLLWRGLPVFVPYLGPKTDASQQFIYGGIFPLTEKTNATPAPAELFAQFETRQDLVYYDWEITAARIAAYEQASPFTALFLPVVKAQDGTHAAAWLKDVQPRLGNVVTEVTCPRPEELVVTRRSQIGLTGIELWLLTRWLDSAEFPKFPYSEPRKPEPGKRPAALPGSSQP